MMEIEQQLQKTKFVWKDSINKANYESYLYDGVGEDDN